MSLTNSICQAVNAKVTKAWQGDISKVAWWWPSARLAYVIDVCWQQTAADWPCDVSLESFRPGKSSAQAAGNGQSLSQAWLYRSSFARGFTPPPACVPSAGEAAGAGQQYPPVKFEVAQMFSACAAVSVVPISLGGQVTASAGGTAVQLDTAPEVVAFEFSCTHK